MIGVESSGPLSKLPTDVGILNIITCPHPSHQNGTVDRKHRQIVNELRLV